jgi:hypothetical protein
LGFLATQAFRLSPFAFPHSPSHIRLPTFHFRLSSSVVKIFLRAGFYIVQTRFAARKTILCSQSGCQISGRKSFFTASVHYLSLSAENFLILCITPETVLITGL